VNGDEELNMRARLGRFARGAAGSAIRLLDASLAPFVPVRSGRPQHPPIFIVGLPRSGTTVVYQAMTTVWRFAYINNITERFPRSNARVSRLLRAHAWRVPPEFTSYVGRTPGPSGPSEGIAFWQHAFPSETHEAVEPEEVDPERERWLVNSVASLSEQFDAPFLSKVPCNSLRISALAAIFPDALFVVVRRDLMDVAQSLLKARRERCGNARGHYSVIPRGLEDLGDLPPVEYVAQQVAMTEIAMREALESLPGSRFHEIDYVDFCAEPRDVLAQFEQFASGHGLELERRSTMSRVPPAFEASQGICMPAVERKTIEKTLVRNRVI